MKKRRKKIIAWARVDDRKETLPKNHPRFWGIAIAPNYPYNRSSLLSIWRTRKDAYYGGKTSNEVVKKVEIRIID